MHVSYKVFRPTLFNNGILHATFLHAALDFLYDHIRDSIVIGEIARVLTHGVVPFKMYERRDDYEITVSRISVRDISRAAAKR